MLTPEELERFFKLLEHLHSGKRAKRDTETVITWTETLAPWNYDQVRTAAFRRAQSGNRFFPDAPEIAAFCPPPQDGEVSRREQSPPAEWAELQRKHNALQEKRRAAGIPASWEEAKQAGMSAEEWGKVLGRAGLDVGVIP